MQDFNAEVPVEKADTLRRRQEEVLTTGNAILPRGDDDGQMFGPQFSLTLYYKDRVIEGALVQWEGEERMRDRLSGKIAILTGAARGIGRAIAQLMVKEGAKVVVCDVDFEAAQETAQALAGSGNKALALRLDVSKPKEALAVVQDVKRRFDRIDILVNNAGICPRIPLLEVSESDFDRIVSVNLKGTFFMSQAVSPVMQEQQSGRIVNVSSIAARTGGVAASSVYGATKAGMIAFTKSFARTLAPSVAVNAVAPGVVDTDMVMRLPAQEVTTILNQVPLGRLAQPEEIASAVVFLASEEASYMTGATVDVNGGWLMH